MATGVTWPIRFFPPYRGIGRQRTVNKNKTPQPAPQSITGLAFIQPHSLLFSTTGASRVQVTRWVRENTASPPPRYAVHRRCWWLSFIARRRFGPRSGSRAGRSGVFPRLAGLFLALLNARASRGTAASRGRRRLKPKMRQAAHRGTDWPSWMEGREQRARKKDVAEKGPGFSAEFRTC